ncbi:hypothetical protein DERP_013749 [Dermatophagoides pteronyssinus]|uniref:Uncharacterized protein n=1 Tax=Dermatophagoides pteronyssinus TaxID=6956 RepID=A0ABQ8JFZ1_DERPT|nr:hypothetical protein DERP_013749 [Dermatophagoides pteronyssinus]
MVIQIIIIWMANNDGVKSIIIHRINNRTKSDLIRFPYKSVYGLPRLFHCREGIYHRFYQCEQVSHQKWNITIDDYVNYCVQTTNLTNNLSNIMNDSLLNMNIQTTNTKLL